MDADEIETDSLDVDVVDGRMSEDVVYIQIDVLDENGIESTIGQDWDLVVFVPREDRRDLVAVSLHTELFGSLLSQDEVGIESALGLDHGI